MVDFLASFNIKILSSDLDAFFIEKPQDLQKYETAESITCFWGDYIYKYTGSNNNISNPEWILKNIKGHFYYLIYKKSTNELYVGNSFMSLLPVYYSQTSNGIVVSNSVEKLSKNIDKFQIDKRFILENILFNYPISDVTYNKKCKLLPTNHCLKIQNNILYIDKIVAIEDFFIKNPLPWRTSAKNVSDSFISTTEKYLPDETYAVALTGGFDGRTLVSASLHQKRKFFTYTFGNSTSEDVIYAKNISNKLGLNHYTFELDVEYVSQESLKNGLEFIEMSNGSAAFARAHYLYATKKLATKTKYIITGNFGSEILRAAHNEGIMFSGNLYWLFAANNYDEAIQKIENSNPFKWINREEFSSEWEEIKEYLKIFPSFNPQYSNFTKNQQFYKIVFDEVFRKYFGAELINQYRYIVNRTPFLDYDFLKEIFKTQLAGVYSDYFTHNPIKRFKGQILYANIIEKTCPQLGKYLTSKGYCPSDLLTFQGKIRVAISFIQKKLKSKKTIEEDDYSVKKVLKNNIDFYLKSIDPTLFNYKEILDYSNTLQGKTDNYMVVLSQAYLVNYLHKKYGQ